MIAFARIVLRLLADVVGVAVLSIWPRRSLEAENLVLRRQLALFKERGVKPRRIDAATRASLALLSRLCDWRSCLIVVRPETVLRWHRAGWRLFWRCKSRSGRPLIPLELRQLMRRMATENPLWGEERIANELLLKLGLRVSSRTVRKYMQKRPPGYPRGDQRWSTFLRNHAKAIVACDFDSMFARNLDASIKNLGVTVLRSPPHSQKANAICERVIGTMRRGCLEWLIPLSESHLRSILKSWVGHYNHGRPHMALGPDVPDLHQGSCSLRLNYPCIAWASGS